VTGPGTFYETIKHNDLKIHMDEPENRACQLTMQDKQSRVKVPQTRKGEERRLIVCMIIAGVVGAFSLISWIPGKYPSDKTFILIEEQISNNKNQK